MRSMTDEGAYGLDLDRFDSWNRPLIRAPPAPTFSHEGRRSYSASNARIGAQSLRWMGQGPRSRRAAWWTGAL
jgi:hypothetical protein